jgi:hypothetical protein
MCLGKRWDSDPPRKELGAAIDVSSTLVEATTGHADSTRRDPTIDAFFNFDGDRYWTRRLHLSGGPPSTSSSTLVVAATGHAGSAPQQAHHRCLLQIRWWPLLDPPTAPPRGPTIDLFFNIDGGRCQTHRQHP